MGHVRYKKTADGKFNGSYRKPLSPRPVELLSQQSSNGEENKQRTISLTETAKVFETILPKPIKVNRSILPSEIIDIVDFLEGDADWIEFENNSRDYTIDWVTLNDMGNPMRAGNNCFAATSATTQHLVEHIGVSDGWTNYEIELYYTGAGVKKGLGAHWANLLKNNNTGEEWVLDYTARQFDENADFPLILRRSEWRVWVSSVIRNKYGGELDVEEIH